MQIVVRGVGPALVMLHGWAMHGGVFEPLASRLEKQFTLYLVDLPGHGLSAQSEVALELDAVARQLVARTPPALWLGWSLGGLVALHAAQRYPASVRGLVMICASPHFLCSDDWPQGMDTRVFRGFADELARDYRATIDRFLLLEAQGSDHARDEIRELRQQVFAHGQPSPERLHEGLLLLRDSDLRAGLSELAMASLWIAGRRDRLVSPPSMRWAAERAPAATYHCVERGGHAPFLTYADELARSVLQFSESLAA